MAAVVGRRVRVFWEGEGEWFEGVVVEASSEDGYFIKYDDGEEQWEQPGDSLVLLPSDNPNTNYNDDDDADGENAGKSDQPAAASPSYSQQEFEYEENEAENNEAPVGHSTLQESPSQQSEMASKEPKARLSSSPPKKMDELPRAKTRPVGRALKGGSAPFFRDEEALREMKRTLEIEKHELTHALAALKIQQESRQRESSELKRELNQLKTQVSLASALNLPSSTASLAMLKPTTAMQWKQKVLDMKLDNEQRQHEVVGLKTASQELQRSVNETKERIEKLRDILARVPKRELLTLVDVQVEIAQLLQTKRELEVTAAKKARAAPKQRARKSPTEDENERDSESNRTAIEKQLAQLELSVTRSEEETRAWKIRLECERAKLQPMRDRLGSLRSELIRFHSNEKGRSVLLRSLFLRLDTDGDGLVDRSATVEAFELILGSKAANAAQQIGDSEIGITFEQFTDAYQAFAAEATKAGFADTS